MRRGERKKDGSGRYHYFSRYHRAEEVPESGKENIHLSSFTNAEEGREGG